MPAAWTRGLTFTGLHLGNTPLMKYDTTDELHTVVFHPNGTNSRLSHGRKCLRQKIIKRLSLCVSFFIFSCFIS